jgi:antitoxin HicB
MRSASNWGSISATYIERTFMTILSYPANLQHETRKSGYVVRFPDLPEALTGGATLDESLSGAADCLGSAIAFRMVDKAKIPAPSRAKKGQILVQVPLSIAPKMALYVAMREQGVNTSQLARLLGCGETSVRRMLDPKHASRPEKLQAALSALGKRITLRLDDVDRRAA